MQVKIEKTTEQMEAWLGEFGKAYTDRSLFTLQEMEQLYVDTVGISRTLMNIKFIDQLNRNIRILEVGANIGNQLLCLQQMGFTSLCGIELQPYAIKMAREMMRPVDIIQGSVFDIPFKDGFFDLVFTSGLLIHIAPADIKDAMKEICRCSKKFIWGYEYYADKYKVIPYRNWGNLLWKADYVRLYLDTYASLQLVKIKNFKRKDGEVDIMFLLEKKWLYQTTTAYIYRPGHVDEPNENVEAPPNITQRHF